MNGFTQEYIDFAPPKIPPVKWTDIIKPSGNFGNTINGRGWSIDADGDLNIKRLVLSKDFAATNVLMGTGAPGIIAPKGSLYLRTDGSGVNNRAYVNTNGGTTWTAISTIA